MKRRRRLKRVSVRVLDARAVGARIREARKRKGWLARDLATATGIPPGTIGGYETGIRLVRVRNARLICKALRRTLDWLYEGRHTGAKARYGRRARRGK